MKKREKCVHCNGEGFVFGDECWGCYGKGYELTEKQHSKLFLENEIEENESEEDKVVVEAKTEIENMITHKIYTAGLEFLQEEFKNKQLKE